MITQSDLSHAVNTVSQFQYAPTLITFRPLNKLFGMFSTLLTTILLLIRVNLVSWVTLMLIGHVFWIHNAQHMATPSLLVQIWSRGAERNNLRLPDPVVSSSIMLWLMLLLKLFGVINLLLDLRALPSSPPVLLCDNRSAIFFS